MRETATAAFAPGTGLRLGVASYSLRNFPRARMIEMVKTLGTPYVNLESFHLPYELPPAGIAAARAAGMPLIVASMDPVVLPRVERFARQYDIRIAIHNHGPEDKHFPSPYDVLRAVKDMDPRMGLCIDVGHTVRTGTDVVQAARDAGARLLDMHAKDLRDLNDEKSQCAVGEGKIPFVDLFRQLLAQRYAGYANLEYEIEPDDPLPGMQRSFAYMRGALAGLGARAI